MAMALRTGEVAEQAGVNVETLRYYERRGLLSEPERRPSGYREYPDETVQIVRFIKGAQELGFSLEEVQQLLRLRNARGRSCNSVREAAQEKQREIERKIEALKRMSRALARLVEACETRQDTRACPLLDALDRSDRRQS
jgi:Hg(II)-responsive transcriptional regulator